MPVPACERDVPLAIPGGAGSVASLFAMTEYARIYFIAFGIVTILGGLLGYYKARSRASLIAGSVSGGLLLLAAWLIPTQTVTGLWAGFAVSMILAGRFTGSFRAKGGVMPNGMMMVLGWAGAIVAAVAIFKK